VTTPVRVAPTVISVLSLGPEAAALRAAPASGYILAVLRTAVYLESADGAIIGIVGADAPNGPLTVRVPDLPTLLIALRDQEGATFHTTPSALTIAETIHIPWGHNPGCTPTLPSHRAPPAARAAAAHTLSTLLPAHDCGLRIADCGLDDTGDAQFTIQNLTSKIVALLGRGPGLTPAGDDVLMGLLAALHWQVRLGALPAAPVAHLSATVRTAAPTQTTRLSTRLLAHAAAGILYAPALALGTALLAGDPAAVPAPAHRLFTIGHTSGADLAFGLLLGTRLGL
jgi:hypothetical protein